MSDSVRLLFPPSLNKGSQGGSVDQLHVLLQGFGFGEGIVPDLVYGETTAARMRNLQTWLGVETDGNFGPATRKALMERTGFDVDKISWASQDGFTTWIDSEGFDRGTWPKAEE